MKALMSLTLTTLFTLGMVTSAYAHCGSCGAGAKDHKACATKCAKADDKQACKAKCEAAEHKEKGEKKDADKK